MKKSYINKSVVDKFIANKSITNNSIANKSVTDKPLSRKPLRVAQLFSVFTLALVLMGSPATSLYAEEGYSASESAIAAVNINTASSEELADALNGIGAKKAQAIVQYRNQNGPFTDKNQLLNIKGIGEATLSKNNGAIVLK
jgi:competence protein ComEA